MFGGKKQKTTGNQSLIGSGAEINGDLRFDGDCFIDGTINGDVTPGSSGNGYLSISEDGCVKGNVHVPVLDLSGYIEGDVYVSDKAVFGASARVTGNVHYKTIEIAAGAEINGQLIHDEGKVAETSDSATADPSDEPYIQGVTAKSAG